MVICILDAGPLIHLDQLGALQLLAEMGMVFCPEVVVEEAERHRPGIGLRLDFIHLVEPSSPGPRNLTAAGKLHAGELAALAWAEEYGADVFLSDDADARDAAVDMKIRVCGTAGIILQAARNDTLPVEDARELLRSIPARTTLHLKSSLLSSMIASLG